jgi:hypothetical protein
VESDDPKILFWGWGVKVEIAYSNYAISPVKSADFSLYYYILKKNPKNRVTGSYRRGI